MPDDKYNGLYIHKELVKGNWYGISSGPKPQTFTGNIDDDPESLRNKALVINSPSENNGKFPTSAYGHECAILTTRYGEGVYLQNLFDTQDNIEYDRVCLNWTSKSSWRDWQRVTTEGDSSDVANKAWNKAVDNENKIKTINNNLGNTPTGTTINGRIDSTNSTFNSFLNNDYTPFKKTTNSSITDLTTKAGKLLNQADNKFINVYQGNAVIDIPGSGNSSLFPYWNNQSANAQWARDHGCTAYNSVMYIANTNADGVNGHEIHLEGTQFRGNLGWILTYDRSTLTSRTDGVYGLLCTWILFVIGGNWN